MTSQIFTTIKHLPAAATLHKKSTGRSVEVQLQVTLRVLHSMTAEALELKLEDIWVVTLWHFAKQRK